MECCKEGELSCQPEYSESTKYRCMRERQNKMIWYKEQTKTEQNNPSTDDFNFL